MCPEKVVASTTWSCPSFAATPSLKMCTTRELLDGSTLNVAPQAGLTRTLRQDRVANVRRRMVLTRDVAGHQLWSARRSHPAGSSQIRPFCLPDGPVAAEGPPLVREPEERGDRQAWRP